MCRNFDQLRPITITRNFTKYASGSVLIEYGETKVLCTANIDDNVPTFLKGKEQGWITAEYAMLPSATHQRNKREINQGKPNPRNQEIQRLIGRSLRSITNLSQLGERQILIDCDVIQADGGTRTASITGAYIALVDALNSLIVQGKLTSLPIYEAIAAVSVGVYQQQLLLDLDYKEDSNCDTDMNVVMTSSGKIIEIQGTAEQQAFSRAELNQMLDLAEVGIRQLLNYQQQSLAKYS
jgi:ribonuclease PH